MRLAVCLSLALAIGCDVESSLGEHDASLDAPAGGDGSVDAGLDAEPDDASGDAAPSCAAADGGACVACQASACCEAFAACALAATCPCIVDCLLQGHALDGCNTACGGADHGEHAPLRTCAESSCAAACL